MVGKYKVIIMNGDKVVDVTYFGKLADARPFARYWNDRTSYTTGTKTTVRIMNANGKLMKVM